MNSEITNLDTPWSADKIRILLFGEARVTVTDVTGRDFDIQAEGPTAYEMRCMAYDGGDPDTILESAQLDMAVRFIRDEAVRSAMTLRSHAWADPDHVGSLLGDARPGYRLIQRGMDLVRREERTRHSRRVSMGRAGSDPVCWRCMAEKVAQPGDECGCAPNKRPAYQRGLLTGPPKTGPKAPYDPTSRPLPQDMTASERRDEIERLARTQDDGPIPGGELYRKTVDPYGVDPTEITKRGGAWAPLGHDVQPKRIASRRGAE